MPKLTASFLDFRLLEVFGVDLLRGTLGVATLSWNETEDWAAWGDFKGAEELSCWMWSEDTGCSFFSGAAWGELWNSLNSKFFLLAALFLVTFKLNKYYLKECIP